MATIELGTVYTASWALGVADVLADIDITVTRPDGEELTGVGSVTVGSGAAASTYSATIPTPIPGRYFIRWQRTTTGQQATRTDVLDVWPEDVRMIIGLDDARKGLNYRDANTSDDGLLRIVIASATAVIEDIVGPVVTDTVTQVADGGRTGIALYDRATAITSVTVDGVALNADQYTFDENAGIVYAGGSKSITEFAWGRQNITIVYAVGGQVIAPNVRFATMELVRHLWQIGHQAIRPAGPAAAAADATYSPMGFAVPKRVIELLAPNIRLDTFA